MTVRYEICDRCKSARDRGEHERALACQLCGGTGLVPTRESQACNRCGQSLCPRKGTANDQVPHGLVDQTVTGGYDSEGLLDLSVYTFSICERCLRRMFREWKIPPKVESLTGGMQEREPYTFAEDDRAWSYSEWVRQGGHATASLHGRCNAEIDCQRAAVYSVVHDASDGYDEATDDCLCEEHKDKFKFTVGRRLVPFIAYADRRRMRWFDIVAYSRCRMKSFLIKRSQTRNDNPVDWSERWLLFFDASEMPLTDEPKAAHSFWLAPINAAELARRPTKGALRTAAVDARFDLDAAFEHGIVWAVSAKPDRYDPADREWAGLDIQVDGLEFPPEAEDGSLKETA